MRNTIAVMNTKGGVGKSTLVLAMAETLSAKFAKNVLVIDADAQASVSLMLVSPGTLHQLQLDGLTIVDLLVASVLKNVAVDWRQFCRCRRVGRAGVAHRLSYSQRHAAHPVRA